MDRYLFFHIPKTAGTSVRQALCDLLGPDQISPGVVHFSEVDIEQISRYRVIAGHFTYDQLAHFAGRRLFTFLRDPVDVVLSNYYFCRNVLTDTTEPVVRFCKELSLAEFVEHGARMPTFFNAVAWRLAGVGLRTFAMSGEELFKLAVEHLESFDFVGIYEDLITSFDLLSYTFGWPQLERIPRENVTRARPGLRDADPDIVKRILEFNNVDAELYRAGKELFAARTRMAWRTAIAARTAAGDTKQSGDASRGHCSEGADSATDGQVRSTAPRRPSPVPPERISTGEARIIHVAVGDTSSTGATLGSGEACSVSVIISVNTDISEAGLTLQIFNSFGQLMYSTRTCRSETYMSLAAGRLYRVVFRFAAALAPGSYRIALHISSGRIGIHRHIDYIEEAVRLEISGYSGPPFQGIANLNAEIATEDCERFGNEYRLGDEIDFTAAGQSRLYRLRGWSDPEPWACWTDGREAELFLRLRERPRTALCLRADVHPCGIGELPSPQATVLVNGFKVAHWLFDGPPQFQQVYAQPIEVRSETLHVLFKIDSPRVPAHFSNTPDTRMLGLAFRTVVISEAGQ